MILCSCVLISINKSIFGLFRKYNRVKLWSLGLTGGGNRIAIIRAAGSISRKEGGGIGLSSEGIASETFIEKIRFVRGM